jgi:hypothetical protein
MYFFNLPLQSLSLQFTAFIRSISFTAFPTFPVLLPPTSVAYYVYKYRIREKGTQRVSQNPYHVRFAIVHGCPV